MATTAEPNTTSEHTHGPTMAKGWGTDAPDQPLRLIINRLVFSRPLP